jgi:hypothetical protein
VYTTRKWGSLMIWVIIVIIAVAIAVVHGSSDNSPELQSVTPAGRAAEVGNGCVSGIVIAVLVLALVYYFIGATAQYTLPQDGVKRIQQEHTITR